MVRTFIVLIGLLALAGCSTSNPTPAASPSAMTDAHLQVLVNDLVQCIRQHGAPGMPDVPVRNGHIVLPDKDSVDQATQQNVPAARQACKAVEDRIPASVRDNTGGQSGGPTAADVPKLREFAKCMRDNGEPDWPDPRPDGSFPGQDLRQGKTPQFIAAAQACQQYWDGPMRFTP
jgi:predicted small lipoprotein YifL